MRWQPSPVWKDKDVYIIGGGPSLKDFDWDFLKKRYTIGCNSAYRLGPQICNICIFGDVKWWEFNKKKLVEFKGIIVTNAPQLRDVDISWLSTMHRIPKGLGTEALGWNSNTGASAVNLALILGAKRVFLLGFDMKPDEKGLPNWHEYRVEETHVEVYERFLQGFVDVARDLEKKFPGREIINISDDTRLMSFLIISMDTAKEDLWL